MIELTVTVIAAYESSVTAERLHFSGVIATLTAGMMCGSVGARVGMGPSTRVAVDSFWQYVAFALNSLVFLLIGLEVPMGRLASAWKPIAVAFFAVTVGRALVVLAATTLLRSTRERIPWRWSAILTWGGLRGRSRWSSLWRCPTPSRTGELVVTLTFGVVLSSILLQGVTAGPLLRWLKLAVPGGGQAIGESVELDAARAALAVLAEIERGEGEVVEAEVSRSVRDEYEARLRRLEARSKPVHRDTRRSGAQGPPPPPPSRRREGGHCPRARGGHHRRSRAGPPLRRGRRATDARSGTLSLRHRARQAIGPEDPCGGRDKWYEPRKFRGSPRGPLQARSAL